MPTKSWGQKTVLIYVIRLKVKQQRCTCSRASFSTGMGCFKATGSGNRGQSSSVFVLSVETVSEQTGWKSMVNPMVEGFAS